MPKAEKSGNWFKRHKIITGVLAFIILCVIVSAAGGGKQNKPATQTTDTKATTSPATKTAPQPGLASQVQAAYLKQIGYGSITELNQDKNDVVGSPENEITSFSDENTGVVKVNVQDNLTSAQVKLIGKDVMVATSDVKSLQWIDVRGTNGTSAEVSRQDAGLAN